MSKSISILGCGWLGHPLATRLVQEDWQVRGSTTTKDKIPLLEADGIIPFYLTLEPELTGDRTDAFFQSEILFINIPPGRKRDDVEENHPAQIRSILENLENSSIKWIIFAGSTSVYRAANRTMQEEDAGDPDSASGRALLEAESMTRNLPDIDYTILRFGGLYGYNRKPGRFMAGKKGIKGGNSPVNLIHQDDAVNIVLEVLRQECKNEIFNCVSDVHPTRKELYSNAAQKLELEPPEFSEEQAPWKIISNERLKVKLGYRFVHPNPVE